MPVATAPVPRGSSTTPRSGSSTTWTNHCPDRPFLPCTVPETLRPFIRSPQRLASHALFNASSFALTRLAQDERFMGTELPGVRGVLHPGGRQLPYHPHSPAIVPGGGLSQNRTPWLPSRATCCVPVKALAPISRAIFTAAMHPAGLLGHLAPHVWPIPWNVHSQATPHARSALPSLAPYVFTVAISHRRIVSLTDRPVTFTDSTPGSTRPRTTSLAALECLRRCLQHVLPDGGSQVRHCGLLHARGALPPETLRQLIVPAHPSDGQPTPRSPPTPLAACCPTCGVPLRVVMRLGTAPRAFVEPS